MGLGIVNSTKVPGKKYFGNFRFRKKENKIVLINLLQEEQVFVALIVLPVYSCFCSRSLQYRPNEKCQL
jgi:hypothetical protein